MPDYVDIRSVAENAVNRQPRTAWDRLMDQLALYTDESELPRYVVAEHLLGSLNQLVETWERLNG